MDTDADGVPYEWNSVKSESDSTTGLVLLRREAVQSSFHGGACWFERRLLDDDYRQLHPSENVFSAARIDAHLNIPYGFPANAYLLNI